MRDFLQNITLKIMPIYNKFVFSNPIAKIYAFNNAEFIAALKK